MRRLALCALTLAVLVVGATPAQAALDGTPSTVTSGLAYPWEIVPLGNGKAFVTERPGRVRLIGPGDTKSTVYADSTAYKFLGLALSPGFATDKRVYLYVTHWTSGAGRENKNASKVIALEWDGTNLINPQTIFSEGIWSDGNHDGGRMAFGPDGKLYVTTGDVHDKDLPQDLDKLNGKILRLNPDGSAPSDNPFAGAGAGLRKYVWSYGHRHPEGIAWDSTGRMWETEHGPSRGQQAYTSVNENTKLSRDEINRIEPGCDYGWPTTTGEQTAVGMSPPVVYSGTMQSQTWAPGGLAIGADERLYVPALYGRHLRSYEIDGDGLKDPQVLFENSANARMRTAVTADTSLWLGTSNTTNTNSPADKVLTVPFAQPVSAPLPPPVRDPGSCPSSPPPATSSVTSGNGAAVTPSPAGPAPTAGSPASPSRSSVRAALRALLRRQTRGWQRRTAGQLAASGTFVVRDRTLTGRRVSFDLALPRAGRSALRLAGGSAAIGSPTSVRLRYRAGARRALRSAGRSRRSVKLRLVARVRTTDGALVTSSATFATKRRG